MLNNLKQIRESLEKEYGNNAIRLNYAYALQNDSKYNESFCQRWMVAKGVLPAHRLQTKTGRVVKQQHSWAWYRKGTKIDGSGEFFDWCELPDVVFNLLLGVSELHNNKFYSSSIEVEEALTDALKQIREVIEF